MSTTYSIGCRDCRKALWIAQSSCGSPSLYWGEHYRAALEAFLFEHVGHALVFGYDAEGEIAEWEEIERPPSPLRKECCGAFWNSGALACCPRCGRAFDGIAAAVVTPEQNALAAVRDLALALEYARVACEHAEGRRATDRDQLARAVAVATRSLAVAGGLLSDFQRPSYWRDVAMLALELVPDRGAKMSDVVAAGSAICGGAAAAEPSQKAIGDERAPNTQPSGPA
jgi:hypothetical protein